MKAKSRNPPSNPRHGGDRDTQQDPARRLRREQTDTERTLWRALRSPQLSGLKFRRQHPIGPYIVDFCCLTLKLAIELDGGQHAEQADADNRRSHDLAQAGYRVLRFWNHEVLMNLEGVLERIAEAAGPSPQPSPGGRGRTEMFSPRGRGGTGIFSPRRQEKVEMPSPGGQGRNTISSPERAKEDSARISLSASPADHFSFHISHSESSLEHSSSDMSHSTFHIPHSKNRGGCS